MNDIKELRIVLTPQRPDAAPNPRQPRTWSVRVVECPLDNQREDMGTTTSKFPRDLLQKLRREDFMPSEALLREAGEKVWESLMTPRLEALFNLCHDQVVNGAHGTFRIVIVALSPGDALASPDLMANLDELPFELLRAPPSTPFVHFIGTNAQTPISRGLSDKGTPSSSDGVALPLRILVVISDPRDGFPPINAAAEKKAIEEALQDEVMAGKVLVEFCKPTLKDLSTHMRKGGWHVLHFAGHGGFEEGADKRFSAYLAFVDPDSDPDSLNEHRVTPDMLVSSLANNRELKLVVLTSCAAAQVPPPDVIGTRLSSKGSFDSMAYHLMTQFGIQAVVAMQFDFETIAAPIFARTFYQGLTSTSVDSLVTDARNQIIQTGRLGIGHRAWANPTVISRSRNGQVFHSACALTADKQKLVSDNQVRIGNCREQILRLFKSLAAVPSEVRAHMAGYVTECFTDLANTLQKQADLIGEAIRLVPGRAPPGANAQCRLVLRPRQNTVIQSFLIKIRIPTADLNYIGWSSTNGPATRTISDKRIGDDIHLTYIDTAANPAPFMANQEHELGLFEFQVLNGRPAAIVDLAFSQDTTIVCLQPQATCFNPLGGLVIIEVPV